MKMKRYIAAGILATALLASGCGKFVRDELITMQNEIDQLTKKVSQMMNQDLAALSEVVTQMAYRVENGERRVEGNAASSGLLPAIHSPLSSQEDEEFITPEIVDDESISLEEREKHAIVKALERAGGNRKQAAAELHISERTLYRKLKGYNIEQ